MPADWAHLVTVNAAVSLFWQSTFLSLCLFVTSGQHRTFWAIVVFRQVKFDCVGNLSIAKIAEL